MLNVAPWPQKIKAMGYIVYLIHFSRRFHHCQHYLGSAEKDTYHGRLHAHGFGRSGVKFIDAVVDQGMTLTVVRTWETRTRELEQWLKVVHKNLPALCYFCTPKAAQLDLFRDFQLSESARARLQEARRKYRKRNEEKRIAYREKGNHGH